MTQLPATIAIEQFPVKELSELREDLQQAGLDYRQVVELIRSFLAERGYGVSLDEASKAAVSPHVLFGPLQRMQETLEKVAVLM
jgi:hypothetical protein